MDNEIPLARGLGSSAAARWPGCSRPRRSSVEASAWSDCIAWRPTSTAILTTSGRHCWAASSSSAATPTARHTRRASTRRPRWWPRCSFRDMPLRTAEMRAALPPSVTHADAAHNVGRAALVVAALASERPELLGAMADDRLHEPTGPLLPAAPRADRGGALPERWARRSLGPVRPSRPGRKRAGRLGATRWPNGGPGSDRPRRDVRPVASAHASSARSERDLPERGSSASALSTRPSASSASGSTRAGRSGRRGRRLPHGRSRPSGPRVVAPRRRSAAVGWLSPAASSMRTRLAAGGDRRPAMRDAAEEVAGLKDGTVWLKWPNDLVAEGPRDGTSSRSLACWASRSLIGDRVEIGRHGHRHQHRLEGSRLSVGPLAGHDQPARARRPAADRQPQLLDAFLARLEPRYEALQGGQFDAAAGRRTRCTTRPST